MITSKGRSGMAKILAATVALLVLCFFGTAQANNLIQDGGFSGGNVTISAANYLPGGVWLVTKGNVDLLNSGYWNPPVAGQGSVDLDGTTAGGISQTFTTTAGQSYTVTFDLSANPEGGTVGTKGLLATAGNYNGPFSYTLTASNGDHNMLYEPKSFTFTAQGSSTTLAFTSTDGAGSYYGPVIGNVTVVVAPVPIPGALLLFGPGLVGLAAIKRRSKK